jgi:hypothetical protein
MATWHQQQRSVRLYHETEWTVVIDPPHQMRALMTFRDRDLAEVYMRNLRANNPGAAQHAYILKPAKESR